MNDVTVLRECGGLLFCVDGTSKDIIQSVMMEGQEWVSKCVKICVTSFMDAVAIVIFSNKGIGTFYSKYH
jgi:hypothetical protein